jgi:hypothetical protein
MAGIKFDSNLQPIFESGDYLEVDGESQAHQIIRLAVKNRLFGVSGRFDESNIENKLELSINRIADNQDFINSVENVSIERVDPSDEDKKSGYKIEIIYNGSENYSEIVSSI